MKRFSLLLLVFAMLAGCKPGEVSPSVPEVSSSVPATESEVLPVDPSPPGETDPDAPDNTEEPPSPPPEIPSVDLARDWVDNGVNVTRAGWQDTYKSGGATTLTASGGFPQTGVAEIDAYYTRVRDDFERLCQALVSDAEQDTKPYECSADFTVECNAGGIVSVSRSIYQYLGGVHGSTGILCETFSVADGTLLTLDDFFAVSREEYTDRLLENIYRAIDQDPDHFYADAKLIARDLFPYDTFVVTKDGLSLFFPEYNIAPYAAGTVRVDIPWGAVHDIFAMPA